MVTEQKENAIQPLKRKFKIFKLKIIFEKIKYVKNKK